MYLIEVHFEVHSEVHPKEGVLTISYYNQPPQSPHFEVFKFSNQKAGTVNLLVIQRYHLLPPKVGVRTVVYPLT